MPPKLGRAAIIGLIVAGVVVLVLYGICSRF